MRKGRRRESAAWLAGLLSAAVWLHGEALAAQKVPFVGCASDGQLGPVAAPNGQAKSVDLDAASAGRLAWYQAQDSFGVLAPRGWNCFYFYGSSGATLLVAPARNLGGPTNSGLAGPAVVESVFSGGTSGRFSVAKYAARLFPDEERAFIDGVIAELIEPKSNFPGGAYPNDRLSYRKAHLLEFETPAGKDGLGTSDRLVKSSLPIVGMARLDPTSDGPDFYLLTVRLPADAAGLASAIVAQAEP